MILRSAKEWIIKNKWWVFLFFSFVIVRVVVFFSFWKLGVAQGDWSDFFIRTDLRYNVLEHRELFRSICGGLPLYFTFTSLVQLFASGQVSIIIAQSLIAFVFLYYSYKLLNLFFTKRLAYIAIFIIAIDPFFAWYNLSIASGNLFILFFILAVYNFLLFLKKERRKHFVIFAIVLALSAITRTNGIFLSLVFSILFLFFYYFRSYNFGVLKTIRFLELFKYIVFLNFTFLVFAGGVMILNKIDQDDYRMDPAFSTNIYFFNVPVLHAERQGITYSEAKTNLTKQANQALGFETGMLNCETMGRDNYNALLAYTSENGKKYIMEDLLLYTKIHLFKMIPFFLQSGHHQMYRYYTGDFSKPNMTTLLLSGDMEKIKKFLLNLNTGIFIYIGGMFIFGLASFSLFFNAIYVFLKDKGLVLFFVVALTLVLYTAFTVSPFSMPRYKIPLYPFFIVSLLYFIQLVFEKFKFKIKK